MGVARTLAEQYYGRTGQPRDHELDATFMYQRQLLGELLDRLEAVLQDEGVPPETVVRVLRCMLYGSPSAADAMQRMAQEKQMTRLLRERAAPRVTLDRDRLGLPPL